MNREQFMSRLHTEVKGQRDTKARTLVPWDSYDFTTGFLEANRYYEDTYAEIKKAKTLHGSQLHYADLVMAKVLQAAFKYFMLHGDNLPDIEFPTIHTLSQMERIKALDAYAGLLWNSS